MKLIISNHKDGLPDNKLDEYIKSISSLNTSNIKLIICPSTKHLSFFSNNNYYILGSQDIENNNIEYLNNNHVQYTIVGHSYNRKKHNETNTEINSKIKLLLNNNIMPILCIGEETKDQSNIYQMLNKDLEEGLKDIKEKIIIAYEPIWAISSGTIPDNITLKNRINYIITKVIEITGNKPLIVYGGSVNENTIVELQKINSIDGYLIGKSSLELNKLKEIIEVVR